MQLERGRRWMVWLALGTGCEEVGWRRWERAVVRRMDLRRTWHAYVYFEPALWRCLCSVWVVEVSGRRSGEVVVHRRGERESLESSRPESGECKETRASYMYGRQQELLLILTTTAPGHFAGHHHPS